MRDKIREIKEYLDDGKGKDDKREPNIGIKLIKTFQRMTLIQEYYSQLIEDIENRVFSNYESSVYKESLTLLVCKNYIFLERCHSCKYQSRTCSYLQSQLKANPKD